MERVAEVRDVPVPALTLGVGSPFPASAVGHMMGSETEDYDKGLFVMTATGDPADLAVLRWMSGADETVDVRGHAGWTGSIDSEGVTSRRLVWEEAPGVIVVVATEGLTKAELQAEANGLRPAGADEWEAMATNDQGEIP